MRGNFTAERAQEQEANRRRQICCMSRCHCKLHPVAITIGLCVQGNNGQKYLSRSSRFNLVNVSCLDARAASGERTQIFTDLVEKLVRSLLISEKGTLASCIGEMAVPKSSMHRPNPLIRSWVSTSEATADSFLALVSVWNLSRPFAEARPDQQS